MRRLSSVLGLAVLLSFSAARPARAGEADDLQTMIDRARSGAADLEHMDDKSIARDETTLLRVWLDEAWKLRSQQKYDDVRVVLNRCEAQHAMIRERLQAKKALADAAEKEEALKRVKESIEKTKKAIQQALQLKAALELKGAAK